MKSTARQRMLHLTGGSLGLLMFITLMVVLARSAQGARTAPVALSALLSRTAVQSPSTSPVATRAMTSAPIPRCTFAARSASTEPRPPLEAYWFSEPRVVLTHTSAIGIAAWLPDGERLLITRLVPDRPREYIETFNVQTGELQRYGERHRYNAKPVWLDSEQAVAFVDASSDKQKVLRIGRGGEAPPEALATGLASPHLAADPDGRRVVFFPEAAHERPQVLDVTRARREALPFALPLMSWQDLPALGQMLGPQTYEAAWHPGGNRIVFYNDTGFYLAELSTGRLCEVDLGVSHHHKRWAFDVQWSPNGQYLAALTTVGDPPVDFTDLTLIDMNTGEQRYLALGLQYLYVIAWAPNSRDLLVIAEKGTTDSGLVLDGLYLVNAAAGNAREMLSDHQFVGTGAWRGVWSLTGQVIALACPVIDPNLQVMTEGRLCIVSVESVEIER